MQRLKTEFTRLVNRLVIGLLFMPLVPWSISTLLSRYLGAAAPPSPIESYLAFYGDLGSPVNLLWIASPYLLYLLQRRHYQRSTETMLQDAICKGEDAAVRELIDDGADVQLTNVRGQTPLHLAALTDNVEVVRMLVSGGANVDGAEPAEQMRPLHNCAINGCLQVCECLLQHGADMNVANRQGDTPLHLAARHGRADIVRLLLDFHADHSIENAAGQTAAQLAGKKGHAHIVELIERHVSHEWQYPRMVTRKAS